MNTYKTWVRRFGALLFWCSAGSAVAQPVIITNVACPSPLTPCAVNPALNKIYLAGGNADTMVVLDGGTFAETSVGAGTGVSVDITNNNYWSAGVYSETATVWNGNNTSLTSIPLGNYCPVNVSVDAPHRVAWVGAQCGPGNDPVWAINADTYAIINGPISSGGVQGPIIVNPATGRLYIYPSSVSRRVNPSTYAVTANAFGQVVGVNAASNLLYAQNSSTTLQIVNGAPDPEVILTTVTLPFASGGMIGVNPILNRIYVGNNSSSNISILSASTGQTVGSVSLSGGTTGVGPILVDASRNRIYALAAIGGTNSLYVLQDNASTPETYTYTGNPFSYVGTSDFYGAPVTSISGYFTVASPIAPNTTVLLTPDTIGGTITAYSFTDGRYTNNLGNYSTTALNGSYGIGGAAGTAPTFAVTTGANGNIINWDLNILSLNAYINSWNVSSWSASVYSGLYDEGTPADGVVADPSQPYDAYVGNSPGTWTAQQAVTSTYSLTASTPGGGSVAASPPGPYTNGAVATLTATVSNGWTFIGWTGSVATNASSFTLTMNSNQTEQAVFGTGLNVQQSSGGTVEVSPSQSLYLYGSTVVLTAIPAGANFFQAWLSAASAAGNTNPYNFTVTNATPTIAAQFAASPTLTLICGSDPQLVNPLSLASDGVNLFVSGVGTGNNQHIFRVPASGGAASILYNAGSPQQVALAGTSVYWIDPNAGPVTDTEILQAPANGTGSVTPIYTGSSVGQPIVDGSGLTSDGVFLYAADEVDGTVWRLKPDGSALAELGPSRYSGYFSTEHYNSVAVSQGVVYIADSGRSGTYNPQVISIPTNGTAFTTLYSGAPFVQPLGIAVGNGMVYVSDPGANNTIWEMPISGGTPIALISGAPFHEIWGMAYVNGTLYVCDEGGTNSGAIYAVNISTSPGFTLSTSTAGGGSFMVSPSSPYTNGTVVTLTATASNGWTFIGWTGSVATNASSFNLAMNSNQTEQAVFGTSLNVQQNPGGTVEVSPGQSLYPFGSTVLLSAVPLGTNFFQTWLDAASTGGSASPYSFLVTNGNPTIAAQFAANPTIIIVTNIAAPSGLGLSAVNGGLNKIYFAAGNPAAEQMVVVDGTSFLQTPVGTGDAVGVDVANNNYWSVGVYSGSATVWNSANSSLGNISLGYCPIGLSVDSAHRVVWIGAQCGPGNDPIWAINADTHAIMDGPISSGGVQGPIMVNPATGRVYIYPSGVSKRVEPSTYAVSNNAFGLVIGVNAPANLLYAVGSSTTLQIINGAPDPEAVLTNVTVPLTLGGNSIGVNPALNRLYVGNSGSNDIVILNATTGQTVGTVYLGGGVTGVGTILVDTNHNRVYAMATTAGASQLYVLADQLSVNPTFTLTASTAGGGSVVLSPPTGPYTNSAPVTLTASASNNWTFIGWTGDVVTNASSFTLTMNSNISEQAVFGTTLSVIQTSGGTVEVSPSQSLYPYGSTVLLTAVPMSGDYFVNWTNSASPGSTNSPYSFVVTNAVPTVEAAFTELPNTLFTLTLEFTNGTATPSPNYSLYTNGTSVTITATPSAGQFFTGWSVNGNGSNANPLTLVMNTNKTVIANFVTPPPPAIAITNPLPGAGFAWPATISIGATASSPYGAVTNVVFLIDGISNGVATNPPFAFLWTNAMVGTHTLTATGAASTGLTTNSAPLLVNVTNAAGTFAFTSNNYSASEADGMVMLSVVSTLPGSSAGYVGFQTIDGSAVGGGPSGNNSSGEFTATNGSLGFNGSGTRGFTVPIIDNFTFGGGSIYFQVSLTNALGPPGTQLGNPSTATVTIRLNNNNNGPSPQQFPTNQSATTGQLTVFLTPPQVGGQWRFPWEFAWRTNGQTASNLMAGDYPVEFRTVPGFHALPLLSDPQVANGMTTVITNSYLAEAQSSLGSLTVTTKPAGSTPTGWQFFGETTWRASGTTVGNLLPDTYQIAFMPVMGYVTPPSLAVAVNGMNVPIIGSNYASSVSVNGVAMPAPLANTNLTNYPNPYAFCGQLQTDVGFGSGVAVTANVVLTAAHLVFNDSTLSYVSSAYWSFQNMAGTYQPEPLAAQGFCLLSTYSSQRSNDITYYGYQPDNSSPASRDLDVAAVYFNSPVARNGYSGYPPPPSLSFNPYLVSSSAPLVLAGYPVDGSEFGSNVVPGVMYATTVTNAFTLASDQVYTNTGFFSYPGNSGGPVMFQAANLVATNIVYFPAAIYLGTLLNDGIPSASIVRAIDSNAVYLITQAGRMGDNGVNNSGGGTITVRPALVTAANPAYLIIQLGPAAAVQAGAAWKLTDESTNFFSISNLSLQEVTNTNPFVVEFRQIAGWNLPSNQTVTLAGGQILTNFANYIVTNPALLFGPGQQLAMSGTTNTRYAIQSNATLNSATWIPFLTNTLTNFTFNYITNHPRPGFYRAVWLTN